MYKLVLASLLLASACQASASSFLDGRLLDGGFYGGLGGAGAGYINPALGLRPFIGGPSLYGPTPYLPRIYGGRYFGGALLRPAYPGLYPGISTFSGFSNGEGRSADAGTDRTGSRHQ